MKDFNGNEKRILLLFKTHQQKDKMLLMGLGRAARIFGNWFFLGRQDLSSICYDGIDWNKLRVDILKQRVDAVISRNPLHNRLIQYINLPIILFGGEDSSRPDIPAVVPNAELTGKMAAEHFLARGFRNFAYCGCEAESCSKSRGESFLRHIRKTSYDLFIYEHPSRCDYSWDERFEHLRKWVESVPKPAAFYACNDCRAKQVLSICKKNGIEVPTQASVLGTGNDMTLCSLASPQLSSIQLDLTTAGLKMAVLLDRLLRGEPMNGQRVYHSPLRVITRESTNIINVEDDVVAKALQYIHSNISRSIQVTDVAEYAGVSRWTLSNRFRRNMGCSVNQQIGKSRVELIKNMIEDGYPISDIARLVGFTSEAHISRLFKRETGFTPREYKKNVEEHLLPERSLF
ncbi:xylose operon transcription regulator XylR [Sedimentisphaera salicampi]|uniref:Xylose operon regulatory protein n=1 Tax=Sedimentisphaera salicampi TaxID=1941349 RepID=A0A1W6LM60_9BACT|nr:DNA-binding transcriptional regulator [Sedimentisphaera salicampi]ARN56857.1 Xylose operon regulatory protein [Sedimentisphaera salicampi]OXU15026.1 Xylose operon regulatory protein [Sedimentisphaera salicampi]